MAQNTIYYGFAGPPITGGDFVSVEHVAGLNRLGFDARAFYGAHDKGYLEFSVPVARPASGFKPDDIMVLGEVHSFASMRAFQCIKVMNNQNSYLTFLAYDTIADLNSLPLAHILVPSDFCAARLAEMGLDKPMSRVRPALPDFFAPGKKQLQIAYAPGKRPLEASFLKGCFRALAPEYADVPWVKLAGLSRQACAEAMAESAVYAGFPLLEGLGLMNLEAMASGCHVVGYTGHGGAEYATPENGDWIAEGDHADFVAKLRAACRLFETCAADAKIAAGGVTAAGFNRANFDRELGRAWAAILGDKAGLYRL